MALSPSLVNVKAAPLAFLLHNSQLCRGWLWKSHGSERRNTLALSGAASDTASKMQPQLVRRPTPRILRLLYGTETDKKTKTKMRDPQTQHCPVFEGGAINDFSSADIHSYLSSCCSSVQQCRNLLLQYLGTELRTWRETNSDIYAHRLSFCRKRNKPNTTNQPAPAGADRCTNSLASSSTSMVQKTNAEKKGTWPKHLCAAVKNSPPKGASSRQDVSC